MRVGGEDVEDEMGEASSPPPPPFGRLPSIAPSPDAGMLWEVQPPMGISPALPFLTGHMLHGGHGGIPPPPPPLPPAPVGSGLAGVAETLPGGVVGNSRKSPRLSPALLAQVRWLPLPAGVVSAAGLGCQLGRHLAYLLSCLQPSPGALLRLDASEAWFSGDPGSAGGGTGAFPTLADLFRDPANVSVLNL